MQGSSKGLQNSRIVLFQAGFPISIQSIVKKDRVVSSKSNDNSHIREAWVIFFILGIIMLNFPFIHIFNKATTILGIPLLILYFFLGWPLSILVIYLFCHRLEDDPAEEKPDSNQRDASE